MELISLFLTIVPAQLNRSLQGGILQLIFQAGPVVKLVLLILFFFSIFSWAIIFLKYRLLKKVEAENNEFLKVFWSKKDISSIYMESRSFHSSPIFELFRSGYLELKQVRTNLNLTIEDVELKDLLTTGKLKKIERILRQMITSQIVQLEQKLSFLATTGNSAPFIGLFGTVWGIMQAFHNIGLKGATSLAIVAPGISEALIATAVGLFAAIPSVIAYNYFLSRIRRIATEMDNFVAEFLSLFEH
jgi:biopolymer transport protein TolQ